MSTNAFIEEVLQPVDTELFIKMIDVFVEAANSPPPALIGHISEVGSPRLLHLERMQYPLERGLYAVEEAVKNSGRPAFLPYVERIRILELIYDNDAEFSEFMDRDPEAEDAKFMSHELLEALATIPLKVSTDETKFEWDINAIKSTLRDLKSR